MCSVLQSTDIDFSTMSITAAGKAKMRKAKPNMEVFN
jgi:hypothetical protein